jgi:hypothetical protein
MIVPDLLEAVNVKGQDISTVLLKNLNCTTGNNYFAQPGHHQGVEKCITLEHRRPIAELRH